MFKFNLIFFLLLVIVPTGFSNNPDAEKWYKKACSPEVGYDWHTGGRNWDFTYGGLCKRAKKNGVWKKADESIVKSLKIVRPRIKKLSKKWGVSPSAVIGILLAENAMNFDIKDKLQDWAVKWELADDGKLLGKEFSYGWAQIKLSAAKDAEKFMAAQENRKVRSDKELGDLIKSPAGSIELTVGIIANAQDKYKNCICDQDKNPKKTCGFDISSDDGILATLFNLGSPGKFCKNSLNNKRTPRPNYFGIWTLSARDLIAEILGPPDQEIDFSFEVDSNYIAQLGKEKEIISLAKESSVETYKSAGKRRREFMEKWKDFKEVKFPDLKINSNDYSPFFNYFEYNEDLEEKNKDEYFLNFATFSVENLANDHAQTLTRKAHEINQNGSLNALKLTTNIEVTSVPIGCLATSRDRKKLTKKKINKGDIVLSVQEKRVCKNDIYYLVITSSGSRGWINGGILSKNGESTNLESIPTCKFNYDTSCREVVEFETRLSIDQSLEDGMMMIKIPEVRGGDYKSDSCRFYPEHKNFQNAQQEALGIISSCANLKQNISNESQLLLDKLSKLITDLKFLDFSEISIELSSLGAVCEVKKYVKSDDILTDFEIDKVMCEGRVTSFYVSEELIEFQKKMAIITSFSGDEKQFNSLMDTSINTLHKKLEEVAIRENFPKCTSLWRDKTRGILEKIKKFDCIKGIELPYLDIGADYYDLNKFSYIPGDDKVIKIRTSEMRCE